MAEKLNYRLKAGAIINCPAFMDGKVFSNDNLTDEIAEDYLKEFPNNVDLFQKVPEKEAGEGSKEEEDKDSKGKE